MINSRIDNSVIVHTFAGDLANRDLIDAKQFVNNNHDLIPADFSVLWDLRLVNLLRSDVVYAALTRALTETQNNRTSDHKRAFVVQDAGHRQRVTAALEQGQAPWPWRVFESYQAAMAWLTPASSDQPATAQDA